MNALNPSGVHRPMSYLLDDLASAHVSIRTKARQDMDKAEEAQGRTAKAMAELEETMRQVRTL